MPPTLDELRSRHVVTGVPSSDDLIPYIDVDEVGNSVVKKTLVSSIGASTASVQSALAAATDAQAADMRSSLGSPKIYNVKTDYGALADGTTDDTAAIQAAINAAYAAGGGIVYFPNGTYAIGGAFNQISGGVAGFYTQLQIPATDDLQANMPSVKLLGESAPSRFLDVFTDTPPPTTGAILLGRSTGTDYQYSMIASAAVTTTWGAQSYTKIQFANLTFRLRSKSGASHIDPQMTAIDMRYAAMLEMEYCRVDTESPSRLSANPITSNKYATAIYGPQVINFADYHLKCVDVNNLYLGFALSEHATLDDCHANACYTGFQLNTASHPIFMSACKWHWCKYGIVNAGSAIQLFGTCQFERYAAWSVHTSKWFDGTSEIYVPSGALSGNLFVSGAMTGGTKISPSITTSGGGTAPNLKVVDMWTGNTMSNYRRRDTYPTYADNAAALSGGLVATNFYKTAAGEVRIVV